MERVVSFMEVWMNPSEYMTTGQVALAIGCTNERVRQLRIAGKLTYKRNGGRFLYDKNQAFDKIRKNALGKKTQIALKINDELLSYVRRVARERNTTQIAIHEEAIRLLMQRDDNG